MSGPTYTPGPWVRDEEVGRDLGIVEITTSERINNNFVPIVQVDTEWYEPFAAEQRANALLITAAPDLLEALEALVAQSLDSGHPHDWLRHEIDQAKAAIAKAKG